ncbi:DUF1376 domain-containing protein [Sinorhizobium fredii]|uniref:DUF1376 domain-containing protein n=1 Tax=Rhizobium fredii TaxID=380 RepID=UPI0005B4845C|nr:DUF1376 domain-containing protein [Sinorhizobium fredii]
MSDEATDVRCLPYMPLQIERLRKSKAWLRCKRKPELAFYMINLWMRAWHEVPAGSIEDDDDVLADAAMASPQEWESLKKEILHGWERRDGRIWHSAVTDIATEGAAKLRKNKNRTSAARQALAEVRSPSVTDTVTDAVTTASKSVTKIVTGPEGKGREGKRIEIISSSHDDDDAAAEYAFEAKTIRLLPKDLANWKKAFPHISVEAELWALDEWAGGKGSRWFTAVSGALAKKERDAIERVNAAQAARAVGGEARRRSDPRI